MKVEVVVDTPEPPYCELSIDSVNLSPETLYLIGSCVLKPSIAPSTVPSELKVNVWLTPSREVFHVPTRLFPEQAVSKKQSRTNKRLSLRIRIFPILIPAYPPSTQLSSLIANDDSPI